MEFKLYNDALSTHSNLNATDINYGAILLSTKYNLNERVLLHLLKNNYVGKFSIKFNDYIDSAIKKRIKELEDIPLWPEVDLNTKLNEEEIKELKFLEQIGVDAMFNMIEYLKSNWISSNVFYNSVYQDFLNDICEEIDFNVHLFDTMITIEENKQGLRVNIIKMKFIDVLDSTNSKELKLKNYL